MMIKKQLFSLTVLLSVVMFSVALVQAQARTNNDWFHRQQQQRILEQQRQQQRELQRQQERERQRQEMRRQAQEEMRRQQRQQVQEEMRRGMRRAAANDNSPRGAVNRPVLTGRSTPDGRPLTIINNRVLAIPKARAGFQAANTNRIGLAQTARWSDSQRSAIKAEVQKIATSSLKGRRLTGTFNKVAGVGNSSSSDGNGGRSGGGRRGGSGGGDDGSGGNEPGGSRKGDARRAFNKAAADKKLPPKGDLTKKFNKAAADKEKGDPPTELNKDLTPPKTSATTKPKKSPTPSPSPSPTPTPTPPRRFPRGLSPGGP